MDVAKWLHVPLTDVSYLEFDVGSHLLQHNPPHSVQFSQQNVEKLLLIQLLFYLPIEEAL
jgi:hypothetical protein